MGNAKSFMTLAAMFALFIGACTYAADVARSIDAGTQLAYELNADQDGKIKTELGLDYEERYSGAQILLMIRGLAEEGADIEVNGTLYRSGSNDDNLDPASLNLKHAYRAYYERGTDGTLKKIVFRSGT